MAFPITSLIKRVSVSILLSSECGYNLRKLLNFYHNACVDSLWKVGTILTDRWDFVLTHYPLPVKSGKCVFLGETRLHVACIKNQPSVVKQLLCEGCNPNLYDNAGWTPLHEASNHGNEECVAELLKSRGIVFSCVYFLFYEYHIW